MSLPTPAKPKVQAIVLAVEPEPDRIEDVRHPHTRFFRHRILPVYRRLFSLVFAANLAVFIWFCTRDNSPSASNAAVLSTPIAANLFVAVLFRCEDFINFLYISTIWIPHSLPLSVRRRFAKIYEFGGIHSGTAVAATVWTVLFATQITRAFLVDSLVTIPIITITWVILAMLVAIVVMAYPTIRSAHHNAFEHVHRFCGWLAVILYWVLNVLLTASVAQTTDSVSLGRALFTSPTMYFLIAITLLLILPWARLRRIEVRATKTSNHATRLYFDSLEAQPTQTIRISTSPLLEWHAFACIPYGAPFNSSDIGVPTSMVTTKAFPGINSSGNSSTTTITAQQNDFQDNGSSITLPTPNLDSSFKSSSPFSVIVSKAGDWTTKTISDPAPTRKVWFRGRPTTGVTKAALLFRSAIIVTTGSGIGPALSSLMLLKTRSTQAGANGSPDLEKGQSKYRLIWSAPSPLETYGPKLLAEIREADPDAVVWDTRKQGRPDLTKMAWDIYNGGPGPKSTGESAYEAVFTISNQRVTEEVTYGLESRGVPAYGPVFDS